MIIIHLRESDWMICNRKKEKKFILFSVQSSVNGIEKDLEKKVCMKSAELFVWFVKMVFI